MKLTGLIIVLFLTSLLQHAAAQTNQADKWKTVNAFSMGDNKSKYAGQLTFWGKTGDGNNGYIYSTRGYKDEQNLVVFGWRYTSVYLIFNLKDELTGMQFIKIYLSTDNSASMDYYDQQKKIISILGSNTKKVNRYENGISTNGVEWTGNEVSISFISNSGGKDGGLSNELIFVKKQ